MPIQRSATKHFQIARALRQRVSRMAPGQTLPTLSELQEEFQVAELTVTRALAQLRREGMIYRPAGRQRPIVAAISDQALARVAMIRPDYPSMDYEAISCAVVRAGRERNWVFDQISYRSLEGLELTRAIGDNDAAVLLPTSEPFPQHLLAVLDSPRRPMVVLQDPPQGVNVPSVRNDDVQVGRSLVEHVALLGHRRILLVVDQPVTCSSIADRIAGWRSAMREIGAEDVAELLVDCQVRPFDDSLHCSYEFFGRWLDEPHVAFTAVCCVSSAGALAVMRALRERGLAVPKDVSVIANASESDISAFTNPPLTTTEVGLSGYGQAVATLVEEALDKPGTPARQITIRPETIVRQSTALPPRSAGGARP